MSFFLSGKLNQSRLFSFRPSKYNTVYGIGNYVQSLRDLCYNSDGFVDASRVYDRFKIISGRIKITLYSFVTSDNLISYDTASLYSLIGAVRYGKNLNVDVTPNSVFERSDWTFPSNIVQVDKVGRYIPYTRSIQIPIKTGITSFKKCFGNLYNVLITLAMSVQGPKSFDASDLSNNFEMSLRLEWEFNCVGEGSAASTLDWVPCMHFAFDRQQGALVRDSIW